jgi:hypothetical protein
MADIITVIADAIKEQWPYLKVEEVLVGSPNQASFDKIEVRYPYPVEPIKGGPAWAQKDEQTIWVGTCVIPRGDEPTDLELEAKKHRKAVTIPSRLNDKVRVRKWGD